MAETAKKTIDQILDEMRKVPESITRKKETSTNWHEKFYNAFLLLREEDPELKNMELHFESFFHNKPTSADILIIGDPPQAGKGSLLIRDFFRHVNYAEVKGQGDSVTLEVLNHAHTGCSMAVEKHLTKRMSILRMRRRSR